MKLIGASGALALCVVALGPPAAAQDIDRIYAEVTTTSGEVHRGFLRWDRNEGSWVDILDGSKETPPENYHAWLRSQGRDGPPVRTIDVLGYRVTWNEADPRFPPASAAGIRFGHLRALEVIDGSRVLLTLRNGEALEMQGNASDLGRGIRDVTVDTGPGDPVDLGWEDLARVDFFAAPEGVRPTSKRLHGTATDEAGRSFTGYIAWDLDEILESDLLDGDEVDGGDDRSIPFGEIAEITPLRRGARVRLRDGASVDLRGSNDVDRGHRGVQISDPGLGMVEIEWRDLQGVRFHPPTQETGYDAFDGGAPLHGVVQDSSGALVEGYVRWDADEGATWEMLDGRSEGVRFVVELGEVARITRLEPTGAEVELRDGRTFELARASDVSGANRGILVASGELGAAPSEQLTPARAAMRWHVVPWGAFVEVRFSDIGERAAPGRAP